MTLPTCTELGVSPPSNVPPCDVAQQWLADFNSAILQNDLARVVSLIADDCWWRDSLALSWDFRTFYGVSDIRAFLVDRLQLSQLSGLALSSSRPPNLVTPCPDVEWVEALFTFETRVGHGNGIVRLVYLPSNEWKAYAIFTVLEGLKCSQPPIDYSPAPVPWAEELCVHSAQHRETPAVLVVGAGQCGLVMAARLKALGVSAVVIERNARIGDQWRGRYCSLRLQDPIWRDQLPYMPFPDPPFWPIHPSGAKLAEWLECYARSLDLEVWTSSTLNCGPSWDCFRKTWTVTIIRDGVEQVMNPRHIVWAVGSVGCVPRMPKIVGMTDFNGKIVHSSQHDNPRDCKAKKVVVIGAGVSGHDVCRDFALAGADVTMVQRSSTYVMSQKHGMLETYRGLYWNDGPPTEIADLLTNSLPVPVAKSIAVHTTERIAKADREMLDGLRKVGFRFNAGIDGSGLYSFMLERKSAAYVDVGACQMIIDGKIKLKNDSLIDRFTETGLKFTDGSKLAADLVVCATGFGDVQSQIQCTFGDEFALKLKRRGRILDSEGEMCGIWRDSGHDGFYIAKGNLPICRFYSKRLALQIKAMEEGMLGPRYSLP